MSDIQDLTDRQWVRPEAFLTGEPQRITSELDEITAAFDAGYRALMVEVPWDQEYRGEHYSRNKLVAVGVRAGEIYFFSTLKPAKEEVGTLVTTHGPPYRVHPSGLQSMDLETFRLLLLLGGIAMIPASTAFPEDAFTLIDFG